MSEPKRKPGVAFWVTVVVLVVYPLSIRPACWISSWTNRGSGFVSTLYVPITSRMSVDRNQMSFARMKLLSGAESVRIDPRRGAINWYAKLGAASG